MHLSQISRDFQLTRSLVASLFRLVSYEEQAISYVWKNDEDTLRKSPSLTTLNAYLVRNATDVCDVKGNWRGENEHNYAR